MQRSLSGMAIVSDSDGVQFIYTFIFEVFLAHSIQASANQGVTIINLNTLFDNYLHLFRFFETTAII